MVGMIFEKKQKKKALFGPVEKEKRTVGMDPRGW